MRTTVRGQRGQYLALGRFAERVNDKVIILHSFKTHTQIWSFLFECLMFYALKKVVLRLLVFEKKKLNKCIKLRDFAKGGIGSKFPELNIFCFSLSGQTLLFRFTPP